MSDPGLHDRKVRAFLDANVLYSAARGGGLVRLWECAGVQLVTSEYAVSEAWQNLGSNEPDPDGCLRRLEGLLQRIEVVAHDAGRPLFLAVTLPDPSDEAILAAAMESNCSFLITGDRRCFGRFFGERIGGVMIVLPRDFLSLHEK